MKRFLLSIAYLFVFVFAVFGSDDSKWTPLYSYAADVSMLQSVGTLVYGVSDGKLFSYAPSDSSFETYGKIYNQDVVAICAIPSLGCLAIGYEDSYIQLLYPNGTVVDISGITNTQWNLDKTINDMSVSDDRVYVSTNFGLVVVDASKGVIQESCVLSQAVYSACENDSVVYLATSTGVLQGNMSDNLQDRSNWETLSVSSKYSDSSSATFADTEITKIVAYKGLLHFLVKNKLICALKSDGSIVKVMDWGPSSMLTFDDRLVAYKDNIIYTFSDLYTLDYNTVSLGDIESILPIDSNSYWVGCADTHLSKVELASSNSTTILSQELHPDGPLSNLPFSMRYSNKKLLVVGGGYYYYGYNNPAQFSIYNGSSWQNCDPDQVNSVSGITAKDFTSVAEDPLTENHYFVSGWMDGIYEFNGTECVKFYDNTNSTLQSIYSGSRDIRVTALEYDSDNNLWMTNSFVSNEVKMMDQDGNWSQYPFSELASLQYPDRLCIDTYGNKWIGTGLKKAGLLIWNDNGTVDNTADDTYQYVSSFVDQDGNSLSIGGLNSLTIKQDLDGNIWLGTNVGPFKVYNSSSIASKSLVLNTIKIPRDDGTDYVDILLENVQINDIAIDGANQKWFATETAGVYLISADGLSTVYHFTKDNSILPSNRVISLAIDSSTGLVYIGTEKGIVSYQSSYVAGSSNYSSVYTYPNPVRPDYYGDITVKGLQYESTVKITDLNGNIINQGTSSGGTYVWDGKDIRGVRVKTGVYLVYAATSDGDQGVVTKIMIVNY